MRRWRRRSRARACSRSTTRCGCGTGSGDRRRRSCATRGSDCRRDAGHRLPVLGGGHGELGLHAAGSALVHVDINREVFNRNFPARVAVEADAAAFVRALLPLVTTRHGRPARIWRDASGHRDVQEGWRAESSADRVTPGHFFDALQRTAPRRHLRHRQRQRHVPGHGAPAPRTSPGCFIAPIDYSCMGYAVPAAVGAKLANPGRDVVALAGDGALLMTGLELLTASASGSRPSCCVLRDGELAQIAQFQRTALKPGHLQRACRPYSRRGVRARRGGRVPARSRRDDDLDDALGRAFELARGGTSGDGGGRDRLLPEDVLHPRRPAPTNCGACRSATACGCSRAPSGAGWSTETVPARPVRVRDRARLPDRRKLRAALMRVRTAATIRAPGDAGSTLRGSGPKGDYFSLMSPDAV